MLNLSEQMLRTKTPANLQRYKSVPYIIYMLVYFQIKATIFNDVGYCPTFHEGNFKLYRFFPVKLVLYVEFNWGYESVTKNGGTRARFITKIMSKQRPPSHC